MGDYFYVGFISAFDTGDLHGRSLRDMRRAPSRACFTFKPPPCELISVTVSSEVSEDRRRVDCVPSWLTDLDFDEDFDVFVPVAAANLFPVSFRCTTQFSDPDDVAVLI